MEKIRCWYGLSLNTKSWYYAIIFPKTTSPRMYSPNYFQPPLQWGWTPQCSLGRWDPVESVTEAGCERHCLVEKGARSRLSWASCRKGRLAWQIVMTAQYFMLGQQKYRMLTCSLKIALWPPAMQSRTAVQLDARLDSSSDAMKICGRRQPWTLYFWSSVPNLVSTILSILHLCTILTCAVYVCPC